MRSSLRILTEKHRPVIHDTTELVSTKTGNIVLRGDTDAARILDTEQATGSLFDKPVAPSVFVLRLRHSGSVEQHLSFRVTQRNFTLAYLR